MRSPIWSRASDKVRHVATNVGALSIFSISPGPRDTLTAAGAPRVEIHEPTCGPPVEREKQTVVGVLHSARQSVVMDIFLARGGFKGLLFSEGGSRPWEKTATRHVESDAKGSQS